MSSSTPTSVLVLGATGFTGRLITRYLSTHRNLDLGKSVERITVDVTRYKEVERAVRGKGVVINAVGPYWKWGTLVVRACVRNAVHYVDLTAEGVWMKEIIREFDYLATKTHSIIVPACGMDSIPSDLCVYLSNKTLKLHSQDDIPRQQLMESGADYYLSPGPTLSAHKILVGGFFFMQPTNRAVVHRTWGLLELYAREGKNADASMRYGPKFVYDEFLVKPTLGAAIAYVTSLVIGLGLLVFAPPFRWWVKRQMPKSGDGPSEANMETGFLTCTNLTQSSSTPPITVQSSFKGAGDPGYLLTSILISEAALSLILPSPEGTALPYLARCGGVLTPVTAMGDVLVERLRRTGHVEFESTVVTMDKAGRKKYM
ncbi:hypothetical protein BD779DRAFT_1532051 [Infundibulicybe gibba]|nr:hypothetical protein BD779DRAFT_1532051 [Infundibulicybe gibba]